MYIAMMMKIIDSIALFGMYFICLTNVHSNDDEIIDSLALFGMYFICLTNVHSNDDENN